MNGNGCWTQALVITYAVPDLHCKYAFNLSVTIADGRTIQSTTCGHIVMERDFNGSQTKIMLQDVHVI